MKKFLERFIPPLRVDLLGFWCGGHRRFGPFVIRRHASSFEIGPFWVAR